MKYIVEVEFICLMIYNRGLFYYLQFLFFALVIAIVGILIVNEEEDVGFN